jgi:hypothetical protein
MPIFAPLERPYGLKVTAGELIGVDVGFVRVAEGCVGVDELDELSVAAANTAESELCHHTGMPSPCM